MLRTYSTNITVSANTAIPFNTDKISVGTSITHPSATNINVNKPGFFLVTFDISMSSTDAGPVTLQLYADGVAIPDAIVTTTLVASTTTNGSFATIIKANPGNLGENVTLTVVPTANLTISNVALGLNRVA